MAPQFEAITEPVMLAEGPHWDHAEQALYFVSIKEGTVHKYVPATGTHTSSSLVEDEIASFIIPIEGKRNRFAVGLKRKVIEMEWTGEPDAAKVVRTIAEVDQDKPKNEMNDGKADPRGRLFTGSLGHIVTMSDFEPEQGSVYRIDPDGAVHKLEDGINISNGLAWDLKERAFYYIDTIERAVRRYDYDEETGRISNRKRIFDYKEHGIEGYPDGMTIDTDGNLWVACYEGHKVLKIDPRSGKVLEKLHIPVSQVTSVTFGGPSLDVLFVTTGNFGGKQPHPSGTVFKVTGLGVKGHPNVKVKVD